MIKLIKINLLVFVTLTGISCSIELKVKSPDSSNTITLELDDNGNLFYTIVSNGTTAVNKSVMGVDIEDTALYFNSGLSFQKAEESLIDETYTLPTGKTSVYINRANQTVFTFKNRYNRLMKVICRAYNDGVAFRYVVESPDEIVITKEKTAFSIPLNTLSWMMDYTPAYENIFRKSLLDTVGLRPLSYPALIQVESRLWMLITEASVYDQPATHLIKSGDGNELVVKLPEDQYSVSSKWESPWRTFIMGTDLASIVESVMVENLNPPSSFSDMRWIEPGVSVFPWWGNYMANSYIDTLKMYVDLAAEMNWEWIEFDVSLVGSPFRTSKLWETTDWLPEFTAYAKSKGINVYGWDEINVLKTPEGREHIYGKYRELGIKGIKIDYIDSDRQYAMCFRNDALRDAAHEKLMVSFHGETMPRGQRRTYPNVMTLEGVRGAEYYTFSGDKAPTPGHNCILPFTRNVVGSMDYTPVTFTIRPENPRITTYAHELALAVIFESGWMVMADRPEAYLNSPARDILKEFESSWDETVFIEGFPGEYICLARRKADKWFIAAINAGNERTLDVSLDFIGDGNYYIESYEDKPGEEMTNINIRKEKVIKRDVFSVTLLPNGGFCSILKKF